MRFSVVFLMVGFALLAGVKVSSAASVERRTVSCSDIIDYTKFPYFGNSRPDTSAALSGSTTNFDLGVLRSDDRCAFRQAAVGGHGRRA
jgi:hypothetical protein